MFGSNAKGIAKIEWRQGLRHSGVVKAWLFADSV